MWCRPMEETEPRKSPLKSQETGQEGTSSLPILKDLVQPSLPQGEATCPISQRLPQMPIPSPGPGTLEHQVSN